MILFYENRYSNFTDYGIRTSLLTFERQLLQRGKSAPRTNALAPFDF
ncbi:hypothetical protein NIES2107_43090 [Nostoc carneum NIES-2107]|nr:hypothetical protein NIES2107_43090 [Nostoc carneum NIES-2107]